MIRRGLSDKDGAARLTSKRAAAPQKEGYSEAGKGVASNGGRPAEKHDCVKSLAGSEKPAPKLFQGHDDLVRPHHVHALARRDLDGAAVGAQALDALAQHRVVALNCLDLRARLRELLLGGPHPGVRPDGDGHTDGESRQHDHAEDDPRGERDLASADGRARRADGLDRRRGDGGGKCQSACRRLLRGESGVSPVRIRGHFEMPLQG